jgi:hypothetical protein
MDNSGIRAPMIRRIKNSSRSDTARSVQAMDFQGKNGKYKNSVLLLYRTPFA